MHPAHHVARLADGQSDPPASHGRLTTSSGRERDIQEPLPGADVHQVNTPQDPLGQAFDSVLLAARAGAEWAWAGLYRDLAPAIHGYLKARAVPDAEDALGEVFVQVVRHIGAFQGSEVDFRAWVFAIARNRAIDEARRRDRRPVNFVDGATLAALGAKGDSEDDAVAALTAKELRAVLDKLTSDQRDVLLLRFYGGLTAEEVGSLLGKSTGAVKTLQVRAIAAIRRSLAKQGVSV